MKSKKPVWLITGASSGLGRAISEAVLQRGYYAVATARHPEHLADLQARYPETMLPLRLDVTDNLTIQSAVSEAERRFGGIDVLVNAAGYGYLAAIEEGENAEIRAQFETNVFGLVEVTKAVLPAMRARRHGTIINISSLGGLVAFGATGYYHATKFAVEALSESLSHEVAPLGINVIIVEPGAFRTEWAGRSMIESSVVIEDYKETSGKRRLSTRAASGKQPGDPAKAAQAIIDAVEAEVPPLRLLLGTSALKVAYDRLEKLKADFDRWAHVTTSVDFPNGG
ncbi:oxidoreductase [Brucella haematophila]|uniref:Oxidoreductase n=1 Tax=Brucella haematophila TaxID=419474 RepID=A0ABX1DRX9_9HYPH|nr:oxidoreductase [Brucella haematophila]NKC04915.1 oxidoreductase [Brucella haematophila]TMV04573.1 oxidoreductase [Brucella haematophila]